MLQSFGNADRYLRLEPETIREHGRADDGWELRIDERLPADNDEYAVFPWICARFTNPVQLAAAHYR